VTVTIYVSHWQEMCDCHYLCLSLARDVWLSLFISLIGKRCVTVTIYVSHWQEMCDSLFMSLIGKRCVTVTIYGSHWQEMCECHYLYISLARDVWFSLFIHTICSLCIKQIKEILNELYKTEDRWKLRVWN